GGLGDLRVHAQAVEQGGREPGGARRLEIARVVLRDRSGLLPEPRRDALERSILLPAREGAQHPRGATRALGELDDGRLHCPILPEWRPGTRSRAPQGPPPTPALTPLPAAPPAPPDPPRPPEPPAPGTPPESSGAPEAPAFPPAPRSSTGGSGASTGPAGSGAENVGTTGGSYSGGGSPGGTFRAPQPNRTSTSTNNRTAIIAAHSPNPAARWTLRRPRQTRGTRRERRAALRGAGGGDRWAAARESSERHRFRRRARRAPRAARAAPRPATAGAADPASGLDRRRGQPRRRARAAESQTQRSSSTAESVEKRSCAGA